jgi:hypothetical protein
MKKNMGSTDRTVRFGLAIIIVVLYFTHVITGVLVAVSMIVMGILIITSFVSFCPLYFPFGISTRKKPAE